MIDCAGIRVHEAFDALAGFGEIYMAKVKASGIIPQISAVLGSCGGGVAVASKLSDITLMDAENGKLFVNSPNAVLGNREEKCDTASAKFQAEAGNVDIVCDSEGEVLSKIDVYKRQGKYCCITSSLKTFVPKTFSITFFCIVKIHPSHFFYFFCNPLKK